MLSVQAFNAAVHVRFMTPNGPHIEAPILGYKMRDLDYKMRDLAAGEGMMDLYTALQPHVTEATARAAAAAAAEQQAAQADAKAAASRDKQISLTLMGLPNVVRSKRRHQEPSPLFVNVLNELLDNPIGMFQFRLLTCCRASRR